MSGYRWGDKDNPCIGTQTPTMDASGFLAPILDQLIAYGPPTWEEVEAEIAQDEELAARLRVEYRGDD